MNKVGRIGIVVLCVVLCVLGTVACLRWYNPGGIQFDSAFQAVLLDTGQVYYGKLQGAGTDYPVLTDVYYIQTKTDPQTKAVSSILVRRGKEWHAPDRMVINAHHLVLIEPVGDNSQVAKLIQQYREK
ncbi:MAG TPA: hypothetical protein VLY23_09430 [Candidatus Acidoferrum sp.]|nr:hypothetical protein [Candidatus Acidoferrum sp.]